MQRIPLKQGHEALVDDADYDWLMQWKWTIARGRGGQIFARRYEQRHGRLLAIAMHRAIVTAPDHLEVDHINGNALDNRRSNLRLATRTQNAQNRAKHRTDTSSRFKGVSWQQDKQRWRAVIICDRQKHHLGYFADETAAAHAYDAAARRLHGAFARPNFAETEETDGPTNY